MTRSVLIGFICLFVFGFSGCRKPDNVFLLNQKNNAIIDQIDNLEDQNQQSPGVEMNNPFESDVYFQESETYEPDNFDSVNILESNSEAEPIIDSGGLLETESEFKEPDN
ncbi:MAG: hypothetical protein PHV17_01725 [Candidatus Omnitrophica bacterium]|nr:hypothetical protein [Candidatus Omnitrophota bacterium]